MQLKNEAVSSHTVHLYGTNVAALAASVGKYLADALLAEGSALIVATPEHRDAFLDELERQGADPRAAAEEGRLELADARTLLRHFMVAGYPDWDAFDHHVGSLVQRLILGFPGELRAYGEMVGVLWEARQFPSAIRLEQYWNRLLREQRFQLYCAYPIGVFDKQFEMGVLDALMCSHTSVLPVDDDVRLRRALEAATRDLLGADLDDVLVARPPSSRAGWPELPKNAACVLDLKRAIPTQAADVLALAERYYTGT